jgi:hypothetical protein
MALPRPLLLALVGVVVLAATFFATRVITGGAEEAAPEAPTATISAAPASPAPSPKAAAKKPARDKDALPRKVAAALRQRKVMVFIFTQPGAADDDATRWASRALNGRRVAVFRDRLSDIGKYKRIVSGVGIAQAPATVIVGRDRKARVLEGFTDRGTLRQAVRDALR